MPPVARPRHTRQLSRRGARRPPQARARPQPSRHAWRLVARPRAGRDHRRRCDQGTRRSDHVCSAVSHRETSTTPTPTTRSWSSGARWRKRSPTSSSTSRSPTWRARARTSRACTCRLGAAPGAVITLQSVRVLTRSITRCGRWSCSPKLHATPPASRRPGARSPPEVRFRPGFSMTCCDCSAPQGSGRSVRGSGGGWQLARPGGERHRRRRDARRRRPTGVGARGTTA